ncbi:Ribonucleases P/MRP protein subunit pop1 [Phytophthora boehmeriae]|uniref:Ribonucleases P/MRP protein subunit pop1 n=1 Tax=Phytophthora boehmeriae TaxID=109152 RepID=A0A8T1X607_9STRA|nr:Ribonucleases P/MRP protein subunit pop1 [Phytophthora boehmeriae]
MAGLGPRVLQVLEFASARAPELQALHELSRDGRVTAAADAKLETQRNQRRRRANAFKSHKMPQRLRATAKRRVAGAERCRQHERRPHKLLESRSWPPDGAPGRPVWLPSHVWHAKRMKMIHRFGHVLAAHRADKSVSSALEAVRQKATLHDASYYRVIELFGLPQVILEALQLVSDPDGSDFHGLRFLAGGEEGHSMLYHEDQFPEGAIAPVSFMWRPLKADYAHGEFKLHEEWQSTKRQLWLWVHPAAYMEAATAIAGACQTIVGEDEEGVQMLDRRGQLCRLKLRGRIADELVASLAEGHGVINDEQNEEMDGAGSDHDDGFLGNETVTICKSNRRKLLREIRTAGKGTKSDKVVDTIFPCDYPDTQAGRAYWEARASDSYADQLKKPKAKRFNFAKHGVMSPFQPQWGTLFSAQAPAAESDELMLADNASELACVLRGGKYMKPFCFYREDNDAADNEETSSGKSIIPVSVPSLVRVALTFPRRGNVAANAMIYAPSDDDRKRFYSDSNWQGCDIDLSKRKSKVKEPKMDEVS